MDSFADFAAKFSGFVWGTPLAIILTGAGLTFTLLTLGIQFKALTHGLAVIRGKYDDPEDEGNISHFQALCAALSATIGLGNISGVAVAVASGGPGAVFWMWIVGFLGMATKFFTCSLAIMYRETDSSGTSRGGPMYYIELGLGKHWKPLAVLFALLGAVASLGAGNMFQANQTARIFTTLLKTSLPGGFAQDSQQTVQIIIGVIMCIAAAMVMIGGIKRIGNVASKLVPSMCIIYCLGALIVIVKNIDMVPAMFSDIFSSAFTSTAATGAFFGVAMKTAVVQGVRRACFSNEAGLGSAPIAHATAKTDEPIREGIVAAMGPFIDTIVICTMTALVVLITSTHSRPPVGTIESVAEPAVVQEEGGDMQVLNVQIHMTDTEHKTVGETLFVHKPPADPGDVPENVQVVIREVIEGSSAVRASIKVPVKKDGQVAIAEAQKHLTVGKDVFLFREGVNLTAYAFDRSLSGFGTYFIPIAALLFAFSTIISWGFYGETCTEYLLGEKAVLPFKFVYVSMIIVGASFMTLDPVINFSDAMLGLMLVPNLIGTLLLAPRVIRASREYFRKLKAGEFSPEALAAKRAARHKAEDI